MLLTREAYDATGARSGSPGIVTPLRSSVLAAAILTLSLPAAAPAGAAAPILPLRDVHRGMQCEGRSVVQGTTIDSFDVEVKDVVVDGADPARILVQVSGPAVDRSGIAEGFSGSPVYCPDRQGRMANAGAISEGIGDYGDKLVLATPIEQMLGEPVRPPTNARHSRAILAAARPLRPPLLFGGATRPLANLLARAGRRAGRRIVTSAPGAAPDFPVQALEPGAAVVTSYGVGALDAGALGTVTYRRDHTIYAFGHPLDDAGRRSLFLQDAYIFGVVANPVGVGDAVSYKLGAPGHVLGTLTSDTDNAVIGLTGAPPPAVAVDVHARDVDTGHTVSLHEQVADETDVGNPLGSSPLSLVAPALVVEAPGMALGSAPNDQSGSMCVTARVREISRALRFCNRYVESGGGGGVEPSAFAVFAAGDAADAMALLDNATFARLHVRSVRADFKVGRGLQMAQLESARTVRVARPGQRVRVVLHTRFPRGPRRDFSFLLRIPRDVHPGRLVVRLNGGEGDGGGGDVIDQLAQALVGGGGGGDNGPDSAARLRRRFAAIGRYDGVTATFPGQGRPHRRGRLRVHAFRDPVVVIQGTAKLTVRIPGPPMRPARK